MIQFFKNLFERFKRQAKEVPVLFEPAKFGFVINEDGEWQYGNKFDSSNFWSQWFTIAPSPDYPHRPDVVVVCYSGKHVGHFTCYNYEHNMIPKLVELEHAEVISHVKRQERLKKINNIQTFIEM